MEWKSLEEPYVNTGTSHNSSSIPASESTTWADTSPLLEAACRGSMSNKIYCFSHCPDFLVYPHIMDLKMDPGIVSRYCSVDEAIEDGAAPVPISFDKTEDVPCIIDIMDHLLACEGTL